MSSASFEPVMLPIKTSHGMTDGEGRRAKAAQEHRALIKEHREREAKLRERTTLPGIGDRF